MNSIASMALSVEHGDGADSEDDNLLTLFQRWVRTAPQLVAVEDGENCWTYAELNVMSARVAEALRDRVRAGEFVAVALDRSVALVAVALALARIGGVYLPLGPHPGTSRAGAVCEKLGIACIISDSSAFPRELGFETGVNLPVSASGNVVADVCATFRVISRPGQIPVGAFYAVLTSGSTGTPKAVAVGARALATLVHWYADHADLVPGARHSLMIGPAFDPHLMEMWSTLGAGATLVVAPEQVHWHPDLLVNWWRRTRVTAAILPTPLGEVVFERNVEELPDLRHLMVGGDRLCRWPPVGFPAIVTNAYGPAEATVVTTVEVMPHESVRSISPPIGKPIPGRSVCVVDDLGSIVPRGVPGELWISGEGLAIGYFDQDLMVKRFVAPPLGLDRTERVYRSGDRVQMRPDGTLEYLGRIDSQIKINGVRMELAEIEIAFERDPRVHQAVAVLRLLPSGIKQIVVFVRQVKDDVPVSPEEFIVGAREWLPTQVVPALVRAVESFPLSVNGKVDRAALLRMCTFSGTDSSAGQG